MSAEVAIVVESFDEMSGPGALRYWSHPEREGGPHGANFRCPCGCCAMLGVRFGDGGWSWNGHREKPTVRPSILHASPDGCRWHGFLTDGVFRPC